jgi:hypothetical protein
MMIIYHPHMKLFYLKFLEIQDVISEISNFKNHLLDVNGS